MQNFPRISQNSKLKISQNYENKNFAATLLLHNLPSATHPPLPSARRFFNAARQSYFEMKTNTEPYFSILSSIILWPHVIYETNVVQKCFFYTLQYILSTKNMKKLSQNVLTFWFQDILEKNQEYIVYLCRKMLYGWT